MASPTRRRGAWRCATSSSTTPSWRRSERRHSDDDGRWNGGSGALADPTRGSPARPLTYLRKVFPADGVGAARSRTSARSSPCLLHDGDQADSNKRWSSVRLPRTGRRAPPRPRRQARRLGEHGPPLLPGGRASFAYPHALPQRARRRALPAPRARSRASRRGRRAEPPRRAPPAPDVRRASRQSHTGYLPHARLPHYEQLADDHARGAPPAPGLRRPAAPREPARAPPRFSTTSAAPRPWVSDEPEAHPVPRDHRPPSGPPLRPSVESPGQQPPRRGAVRPLHHGAGDARRMAEACASATTRSGAPSSRRPSTAPSGGGRCGPSRPPSPPTPRPRSSSSATRR